MHEVAYDSFSNQIEMKLSKNNNSSSNNSVPPPHACVKTRTTGFDNLLLQIFKEYTGVRV
jgi:hypothetical protein